jgi:hypothetical protein
VTIIETTKGYLFGGFTPLACDSGNRGKCDSSQRSFLFTVKNHRGNEVQVFPMKADGDSSRTIYCDSSYGPLFGCNFDIRVCDDCNANASSSTSLGGTFLVFTGEQRFMVKEIEIFVIKL